MSCWGRSSWVLWFLVLSLFPRLRVLELLVQKNVVPQEILLILLYILPTILTFSLPMAALLAILVSFGRLSADNEVTAMRSSGVSIQSLVRPVLVFAGFTFLAAFVNANYWQPRANQKLKTMRNDIALKSISTAIRPGVFEEGFSNLVLYIRDATPDKSIWKGVFLADVSKKDQPKITLAETGTLFNDIQQKKLQLHLSNGATHSVSNRTPGLYDLATFNETDIPVATLNGTAEELQTQPRRIMEMDSLELLNRWKLGPGASPNTQKEHRERLVELSKRLAVPFGVIIFSILAIPLGVISKKGGKSYGFVVSLGVFLIYFLLLSVGEGFAKSGRLSPVLGPWVGNLVFLVLGVYLLAVSEKESGWSKLLRPIWTLLEKFVATIRSRPTTSQTKAVAAGQPFRRGVRWTVPLILDKYVIAGFLKYFFLVLCSFAIIFIVFTFFELLEDVVSNQIPVLDVLNYFRYLLPQIVFYMIPMSVLVAVLVNFGVLARSSQIVAMKASGVSLYRLALSLMTVTVFMSGVSFLMQEYVLPACNQKQDALRDKIKGRRPQTYLRPDRKCMMGERAKIFYYNFFDEHRNLFGDLSVFEFDPGQL